MIFHDVLGALSKLSSFKRKKSRICLACDSWILIYVWTKMSCLKLLDQVLSLFYSLYCIITYSNTEEGKSLLYVCHPLHPSISIKEPLWHHFFNNLHFFFTYLLITTLRLYIIHQLSFFLCILYHIVHSLHCHFLSLSCMLLSLLWVL